jgi:glutathione S-transferase
MKLYFTPRTRAIRPRWLLEELGAPYELVRLDPAKQENRAPSYLALQPFGDVPALVDGDVTLFESSAICLYLADRFPEKQLAPPVGSADRGYYYQWLLFAEVSIEPEVKAFLEHSRLSEEEKAEAHRHAELARHRARLEDMLQVVERGLGGGEHLVGGRFTAADLVMASILHLAHTLHLIDGHPRLFDYVALHSQRPAVRRAVSA